MGDPGRVVRLCGALLWRAGRDQRARLVLTPLLLSLLCLGIVLAPIYLPDGRQTTEGLRQALGLLIGSLPEDRVGVAAALLLVQGPYLVGILSAVVGARTAEATIGAEAVRGGLELLLAAPYRPAEVFAALLGSSFVLTALAWGILTGVAVGLPALWLLLRHGVSVPGPYLGIALFTSLPMALWANLIALSVALLFPSVGLPRVGTSASLAQFVAILPAMGAFLFVTVRPDVHPATVGTVALVVGALGLGVGTGLLARWFRPEVLLEG